MRKQKTFSGREGETERRGLQQEGGSSNNRYLECGGDKRQD